MHRPDKSARPSAYHAQAQAAPGAFIALYFKAHSSQLSAVSSQLTGSDSFGIDCSYAFTSRTSSEISRVHFSRAGNCLPALAAQGSAAVPAAVVGARRPRGSRQDAGATRGES